MARRWGSYMGVRHRREIVITAGGLALLLGAAILAPMVSQRVAARVSGTPSDSGTLTPATLADAWDVVGALGDQPTDDRLIAAVRDKKMRGRRLAIEVLGEARSGDALPLLESIVHDRTETPDIRIAALEASYLIAAHQGRGLADQYQQDPVIGSAARRVLTDTGEIAGRRSRVRALLRLAR